MPILVFTILTPTLAFYVYALVQFWAEFRRRRHGEVKVVMLHDARLAPADFEPFPEEPVASREASQLAMRPAAAIRPFLIQAAAGRNYAVAQRPQISTARLNNLCAPCGSAAAIPAFKRAAKG